MTRIHFRAAMLALGLALGGAAAWAEPPPAASAGEPALAPVDGPSFEQACASMSCQHDVHVRLVKEDGTVFEHTYARLPPSLQQGMIAIYPGQTLHVEAAIVDGRLQWTRVVDTVEHPQRTLTVHFWQSPANGMMLKVDNPFGQALKFHMGIMPLAHPVPMRTTSCPIIAHGMGIENWPDTLFQVFLADGRAVDNDKLPACTE